VELRFGEQLHTRVLAGAEDGRELNPGQVAAYVAKYSCKASHEQITSRDTNPGRWRDRGVPEQLADVLRAAQLRVLAPDLTEDEIAWLAVCCRGQDRQARLVAVVALGETGNIARMTVDWSLVACLFDPDDSVVARALDALAKVKSREVV
jgi:hypothetical protein